MLVFNQLPSSFKCKFCSKSFFANIAFYMKHYLANLSKFIIVPINFLKKIIFDIYILIIKNNNRHLQKSKSH